MINLRGSLAAAVLLTLPLSACTPGSTKDGDVRDANAAIAASVAELGKGNYSFIATYPGGNSAGTVHLPSGTALLDRVTTYEEPPTKMTIRIVGPYRYSGIGAPVVVVRDGRRVLSSDPGGPWRWTRVDTRRLTKRDPGISLKDPDVTGARDMIRGVRTAAWTGATITGTLDATGTKGHWLASFEDSQLSAMEGTAASLPYRATLDDAGRLARLVLDVPAYNREPAGTWVLDLSGYGSSAEQGPPPAGEEVIDWPESHYEAVNA